MNKHCTDGFQVLMMNIERIHSNIKHADAKAGSLSVVSLGFLTILYQGTKNWRNLDILTTLPTIFCMLLLISSLFMSFNVVWPRGKKYCLLSPGFIDTNQILKHSRNGFVQSIKEKDEDSLFQEAHDYLWQMSKIDREKYASLDIAVRFSLITWGLSTLTLVFVV